MRIKCAHALGQLSSQRALGQPRMVAAVASITVCPGFRSPRLFAASMTPSASDPDEKAQRVERPRS